MTDLASRPQLIGLRRNVKTVFESLRDLAICCDEFEKTKADTIGKNYQLFVAAVDCVGPRIVRSLNLNPEVLDVGVTFQDVESMRFDLQDAFVEALAILNESLMKTLYSKVIDIDDFFMAKELD